MRIRFEVRNTTPIPPHELVSMDRPAALKRSLLSAHALIAVHGGAFVSPLERDGVLGQAVSACENVNTWPVLATPDDDVVLGAAYFLPDHPQIAPESKGQMFDNTEIEEALLLHVKALSDSEREEIAAQDPQVREMLARADAATAEDVKSLHGRIELRDSEGPHEVNVDGRVFHRGQQILLTPSGRDPHDSMLSGHTRDDPPDPRRLRRQDPLRGERRRRPDERGAPGLGPLFVLLRRRDHRAAANGGRTTAFGARNRLPGAEGDALMARYERQILVAGVGNSWMQDDAFGGKLAERLSAGELPAGVSVADFGTGGLDLAYEVMRGYDALVLLDVSRQGGEPGTLYVMEPTAEDLEPIDDGEVINPHGMDPLTVLRFVKAVGGWPGKVVVVACEPTSVEEMGLELSPAVAAALERAEDVVRETIATLLTDAGYEDGGEPVAVAPSAASLDLSANPDAVGGHGGPALRVSIRGAGGDDG